MLATVATIGGRQASFDFIERLFADRLDDAVDSLHRLDYKSALQEVLARDGKPNPDYKVSSTGPDHDKTFTAKVMVARQTIGRGEGRSKKSAEQAAAADAYETLVES